MLLCQRTFLMEESHKGRRESGGPASIVGLHHHQGRVPLSAGHEDLARFFKCVKPAKITHNFVLFSKHK
jgi:hypothetical protein